MNRAKFIYNELEKLFPYARCELIYHNEFELLIDVVLSAQTTDKAVNKVNSNLFKKYPDSYSLANAELEDIQHCIKSIGLYKNKAKHIKNLSIQLVEQFDGKVPNEYEKLILLDGVGRKTANVVLAELFNKATFGVDTHVQRIAIRLNIAEENDSVLTIEKKLCDFFPKEKWHRLHHLFIFFGRYKCHSKNPICHDCPFIHFCKYKRKDLSNL